MKYLLVLILIVGCSPKYEVIQELYQDDFDETGEPVKYHLEHTKNRSIVIVPEDEILTDIEIKEGDIVKLKPKKKHKKDANN